MLRILILILICAPQFLWSQSFKNEADLIKQANENFEDGRFIQALPLFSQLVSLHPNDTDYNFKFGTCVIYSGVDKETAIRHLSFSTKKSVKDPRAHYYLGLAQHLNYNFREAKKAYGDFMSKADEKTRDKFDASRQIEMCSNGEGLLSSITDLVVLEKKEVSENDFYRYYNLEEIGGKVIAKPEELITKNDKKKGLTGVVHFDRSSDYIFYSSYGNDDDQLDLYRVQPLSGGKFSKPEKLKGEVNTNFDEDFAFMHSDGETLYFASKGHNSMGGFDVFKARYDINSDMYIQVKNLDFAVNTPDDDLFYLVDSTKTMAYFASGRSSALDNLHVYKVRVDAVPVNLVIVQGDFISRIDENQKNTKISITDEFTGMNMGEFYTNDITGNYTLPFERAGTYKFEVEVENSPMIHEGIVEIPSFDKPVALRQEIILSKENGVERLQIKNFFDEILDEDIAQLTQDILRRKAGLDVNADQMSAVLENQILNEKEESEVPEEVLENSRPIAEAGAVAGFNPELTISEIANDMKAKASDYAEESVELNQRAKEAYAEAKIKQTAAAEKLEQGKALLTQSDESNTESYIENVNKGNLLLAESKSLSMESQSLLEVVKSVGEFSEELKQRSDSMSQSAAIIESSQDYDEVLALLKKEKERDRSTSKEDSAAPEVVINKAADFTTNELENLVSRIQTLREEEADFERKLAGKNRTLEATSKKSDRENIEVEITAHSNELVTVREDLDKESEKVELLSYEAENYALQRDFLENVNSDDYDFEGEAQEFNLDLLDDEIAQSEDNALQAISLIPEDQEQIASASEELKSRVELNTIQSKVGELSSGLELKELTNLRQSYENQIAELPELNNVRAEEIRNEAVKTAYSERLIENELAIEEALSNSSLSVEEIDYLSAEKELINEELGQIELKETLASSITKEEIKTASENYAHTEIEELENWKNEISSLDELESTYSFVKPAEDKLEEAIRANNEKIALSSDPDEIISLNNEVMALNEAVLELRNTSNNTEFLNQVFQKQLEAEPENELVLTEQFRSIIEQKIISLDTETHSAREKSNNLTLKKKLSDQLTLTKGAITNLQAQEQLALENAAQNTSLNSEETSEEGISETGIENATPEDSSSTELEIPNLDSASITESLSPGYKQKIEELVSNEALGELEISEERIRLNNEVISNLEAASILKVEELDSTEKELVKDNLQLEINAFDLLKSELTNENANFQNRIDELKSLEETAAAIDVAQNSASDTESTDNPASDNSNVQENLNPEEIINANPEGVETAAETPEENLAEESATDSSGELSAENSTEVEENSTTGELSSENITEELNPITEVGSEELAETQEFLYPEDLSKEEIDVEVRSLPAEVTNSFYENSKVSTEISSTELTRSEAYEELIENNPQLNSKLKNLAQVSSYSEDIESLKTSENPSKKEEKKLAKLEKKRAKIEVKNSPHILGTAQQNYSRELNKLDEEILSEESQLNKSPLLLNQIQKLRNEAQVYNEDAEIYKGLAEKSSKKNIQKKNELYKEATAKQLTASANLEKADWLVSNSASLAELSPQSLAAMLEDENLASTLKNDEEGLNEDILKVEFADKVLLLEDSIADVSELEATWNLSTSEMEKVRRSSAFVEYEEKSETLSENVDSLVKIQSELQSSQSKAKELEDQAQVIEDTLDTAETEAEKDGLKVEIRRLRASAQVEYETAEELDKQRDELMAESEGLRGDLLALQRTMNPTSLLASVPAPEIIPSEDAEGAYSRSLDLSSAVNQTVFSKTKDVYSDSRPIPVGVKLPEGLVYKVQVGAFRNPISQTLYNDFAPVSGEKLTNGITRYTAGVFTGETIANDAKKDIRNLGFSDAFVVAYLNGERISLSEARNIGGPEVITEEVVAENLGSEENSNSGSEASEESNSGSSNPRTESSTPENVTEEDFNPTESDDDYYERFPDAAEANQIEVLSGLFYTVQVGVYSKPVPSKQIYDISPLNSERLTNNNIRYTTGIYNNLQEAVRRKEQVQGLGIGDAFVTAYYNGKRISISAAKQKFTESGIEVTEVSNQLADNRNTSTEPIVSEARPIEKVEYVIYIGTFKDEVPASVAKAMLFLEESRGIVQEKKGDEVTYFTRPVKSESTAKIIQQEFESYEVYSTEIREITE